MPNVLDRRTFIQFGSALAAWMGGEKSARPVATPSAVAPQLTPNEGMKFRNPVVAIQVPPYVWIDEGIDKALDNMQGKGGVNTVWAYTLTYSNPYTKRRPPPPACIGT